MTITRTCTDLDAEISSLLADGYRLDMIMPADSPRFACLSRDGEAVRVVLSSAFRRPVSSTPTAEAAGWPPEGGTQNRCQTQSEWQTGRAGMEYRDLIPDRLGGFLIASHIRILDGGEVPDYIHHHKLQFQMIYCKAGWIRVVYECQGEPFVMNAGDCVLQPPEIRHRVLESSAGAEVIELSSPAVHETWVDHDLDLPSETLERERVFGGQNFVRHVADGARWICERSLEYRDTGIAAATNGRADVRILRATGSPILEFPPDDTAFVFVLKGSVSKRDAAGSELTANDSIVTSPDVNRGLKLTASPGAELLQVTLAAEMAHFFFAVSVPTDVDP